MFPKKCFGPLFFRLFINDFPYCVINRIIFTYYDDMKLLPFTTNPILIQNDIDSLSTVKQLNGLNFHPSKSTILCFGSTHETSTHLSESVLEQINDIKDLGLLISNTLNWSNHVDKQIAKCSKVFNFIAISIFC